MLAVRDQGSTLDPSDQSISKFGERIKEVDPGSISRIPNMGRIHEALVGFTFFLKKQMFQIEFLSFAYVHRQSNQSIVSICHWRAVIRII